jgi:hypothetical protein
MSNWQQVLLFFAIASVGWSFWSCHQQIRLDNNLRKNALLCELETVSEQPFPHNLPVNESVGLANADQLPVDCRRSASYRFPIHRLAKPSL